MLKDIKRNGRISKKSLDACDLKLAINNSRIQC